MRSARCPWLADFMWDTAVDPGEVMDVASCWYTTPGEPSYDVNRDLIRDDPINALYVQCAPALQVRHVRNLS